MNTYQRPLPGVPLRPDPGAVERFAAKSFVRGACALLLNHVNGDKKNVAGAISLAETTWPDDRGALHVIKAAVSPATMTTASVLAQQTVAGFVSSLAPVSAAAALMSQGVKLNFDTSASIMVPAVTPPTAAFVGEGQPIPAEQATVGGPILTPFKIACIAIFTRELTNSNPGNVEALIGQALREAVVSRLDSVLLGTAAASAGVAPAGILNTVSATTPSAVTPLGEAMAMDLAKLAGSVLQVSGPVVFVMTPEQAMAVALRAPNFGYPVLPSDALPAGTVIAISAGAFASVLSAARIEPGDASLLHTEDTNPLPIATGAQGSGVLATPARSLWQTDCIGIKVVLPCSWAMRSTTGVAWMSAVTW
jgi:hypothetical protein